MDIVVLVLISLVPRVCSSVATHWRFAVEQGGIDHLEAPLFTLDLYDSAGRKLSGTLSTNLSRANIEYVLGCDHKTMMVPSSPEREFLHFECQPDCEIKFIHLHQRSTPSYMIQKMRLDRSPDAGVTWEVEWSTFDTNAEFVWWPSMPVPEYSRLNVEESTRTTFEAHTIEHRQSDFHSLSGIMATHWRLRVTQYNPSNWEGYFYSMAFYDPQGSVLSGTFSTSPAGGAVAALTDNDSGTSMRFPPGSVRTIGDYVQFVCSPACEVGKVTFSQHSSPDNRIFAMSLDYSLDGGSSWQNPWPTFNTNTQQFTLSTVPTAMPTAPPTRAPSCKPTTIPSVAPTARPTADPSAVPTYQPTPTPTVVPTTHPTADPTVLPTVDPTAGPTVDPTAGPTVDPTAAPTFGPTLVPTASPTTRPTAAPTLVPTATPTTALPTSQPSGMPSAQPTSQPSMEPTGQPTEAPSSQPTSQPTIDGALLQTHRSSPTYGVRNAYAFAALTSGGAVLTWGEAAHGGNSSAVTPLLGQGITTVVASKFAYTALTGNGTPVTWGGAASGIGVEAPWGQEQGQGLQVSGLVPNEAAFAGVAMQGGVSTAGAVSHGGGHLLSEDVISVAATAGAFAAVKADGTVVTWGSPHYGGQVPSAVTAQLQAVRLVVASRDSFAAVTAKGRVVTWGSRIGGGDSSRVADQLRGGVVHVVAARAVFAAFKSDSSLVTWGYGAWGGDSSAVAAQLAGGVRRVFHTSMAMVALKTDGTVVTWGSAAEGGDSSAVQGQLQGVAQVYATGKAFAALTVAGGVVAWGKASDGGSIPSDKASTLSSGVVSIHHTNRAFAALKGDGSLVVWGQAGHGGRPSAAVEALLTSGVHTVCANDVAFSAIKTDGSVVAWGHPVSVPNPGVQFTSDSVMQGVVCA